MKRYLAILLAVMLSLSLVLTGCGGQEDPPADPGAADPGAEDPGTADPGAEDPAGAEGPKYKVANIVNGALGDKSFFDSCEAGLVQLENEGLIEHRTVELGATEADQPKWRDALYELSDDGSYDLIICGTFELTAYLAEVAPLYPEQKYLLYDSDPVAEPNVVTINYRQNDMGYLVGVFAAAMTSKTDFENINADNVLGFVGGVDSPVINDFLVGYIEGAQSVDPEIKVDVRYVGDYYDTAGAKERAGTMITNSGADIIWGVAGRAGNGAAEAASELGAWFIGVDSDQELTFTGAQASLAEITLTSGLKNIGNSVVWLFNEWEAGNAYWGETLTLGLDTGGVGIVTDKNFASCPEDVQQVVLQAEADVTDGTIVVGTAFGDDPVDIIALRDAVTP